MKTRRIALAAGGCAVLISAGAFYWQLRPEAGYDRLVEAAAAFDQTRLAQMSDEAALAASYEVWIRTFMRDQLDGNADVAGTGLQEAIISNNESFIVGTASAYASPAGIRALVEKCDPREQSDEARAKAPDSTRNLRVVGWSVVEISCQAPGGGAISYDMERTGFNKWQIKRVRLPRDMDSSLSQRAPAGA